MYHASRPAPPRPTSTPYLPRDHPFATYIVPYSSSQPYSQVCDSTTSLDTIPSYGSRNTSYPSSPSSTKTTSSYNSYRTPKSSLTAPLSPKPSHPPSSFSYTPSQSSLSRPTIQSEIRNLGHYSTSNTVIPTYAQPLPELSILDNRPRQTLLSDLEFIINKKLHFPFLEKRRQKKVEIGSISAPVNPEGKPKGRLVKERVRDVSWEDDFDWEGVKLVSQSSRTRTKGYRGVKEGNWV